MIFILSDRVDSGKSTFCMKCIDELIPRGVSINGWITPAHMTDGRKTGHDFVAIENSAIQDAIPFTREDAFENSFSWRRWYFNQQAFDHASQLVDNSQFTIHGSQLFVMDEIGPLELDEKGGFFTTMQRALSEANNTFAVIRTGLVDKFINGHKEFHQFSIVDSDEVLLTILRHTINSKKS